MPTSLSSLQPPAFWLSRHPTRAAEDSKALPQTLLLAWLGHNPETARPAAVMQRDSPVPEDSTVPASRMLIQELHASSHSSSPSAGTSRKDTTIKTCYDDLLALRHLACPAHLPSDHQGFVNTLAPVPLPPSIRLISSLPFPRVFKPSFNQSFLRRITSTVIFTASPWPLKWIGPTISVSPVTGKLQRVHTALKRAD